MNQDELSELAQSALKSGADAAEVVYAERQALSVSVRLSDLEEVEREESRDLGVRVLVGRRHASVSGSDLSAEGRRKLVERVVQMARLAAEDPYAGLPPRERLALGAHIDLDLFDPSEPTPELLEERAMAAEGAALAIDKVSNSEGASASWGRGLWRLATSDGFYGEHRGAHSSVSVAVVAAENGEMEVGYDGRSKRWAVDLPSPESLGAEAGRRAAAALGARKLASSKAPVIFENRQAASLLSPLIGAIAGPAVARGVSFLKDKLGQRLLPQALSLIDDPHKPRGAASSPFDDEGVTNSRRALIDEGVLTTWLLNSSSARQLKMETTGHASRGLAGPPGVSASNLSLTTGTRDLAGLMADAGSGLLVSSMFGPSLNANTGDWSVGCAGFWFEGGEIAYPVNEITVAGNLIDLYGRLTPGSDPIERGGWTIPSLLIDSLAIAGK
ncbi:MAG TPA: TldD/PmbA family protein [Caulobacteraceae bacterium]|jgi:PmbA protein|nr:TldD/PmbA family protein [Caulobacteraceae bacterium]